VNKSSWLYHNTISKIQYSTNQESEFDEAALMYCVDLVLMRISGPNYHLVPNFCKIIEG